MHQPSHEQINIVNLISQTNIICDAVAGAGKTTTVLHIAKAYPNQQIIQFTYNKALRMEVQQRAMAANLTNLRVYTYHSFAVKHYNSAAHTDDVLCQIHKHTPTVRPLPRPNIIVIDEAQDIKAIFYGLLRKIIYDIERAAHANHNIKLLIMGDHCQSVYTFNGTDSRYLTMADQLFYQQLPWCRADLLTSYRITHEIAQFVNTVMCHDTRPLLATKSGPPVLYYSGNAFKTTTQYRLSLIAEIDNLIAGWLASGDRPGDIFVLGKSVRSNNDFNPIKKLENQLVRRNVPCYAPISDDAQLQDNIIAGKIVFSSFHQAKGRERKYVICFNFDTFNYPTAVACPAELYVAATRAQYQLVIVQTSEQLPWLRLPITDQHWLKQIHNGKPIKSSTCEHRTKYDVTRLLKFLPAEFTSTIKLDKYFECIEQADPSAELPSLDHANEDVCDINGLAIPMIHEYMSTNTSTIIKLLDQAKQDYKTIYKNAKTATDVLAKAMLKACPTSILLDVTMPIGDSPTLTNEITSASTTNGITSASTKLIPPAQTNNSPTGLIKAIQPIILDHLDISAALHICNTYSAISTGIFHRVNQLTNYEWLTIDQITSYIDILASTINSSHNYPESYHVIYEQQVNNSLGDCSIFGRVDMMTKIPGQNIVWELKCTTHLTIEHKLQLLIYATLLNITKIYQTTEYRLLNMCTGECWALHYNHVDALKILDAIINLQNRPPPASDEDFLATNRHYPPDPLTDFKLLKRMSVDELKQLCQIVNLTPPTDPLINLPPTHPHSTKKQLCNAIIEYMLT